jgi:nucleoid DNA-binding protein
VLYSNVAQCGAYSGVVGQAWRGFVKNFPAYGKNGPVEGCAESVSGVESRRLCNVAGQRLNNHLRGMNSMAKKATPKAPAKMKAVKEKMTKSQMIVALADDSGLSKKEVTSVMGSLERLIEASIGKRAAGEFTLPGLMKITTVRKPAVKARKGINPFTGEETMFKAKPASTAVKVRPLKKMKEFAN